MTLRSQLARLFGFGPDQPRLWVLSVRQWVWILVGISTAVQLFIAVLSALEFRQGAYDLGLSMQAFSNVGDGHFFWAAGPFLTHGTVSVLDNHFSWVYFAVYPIYAVFPSQFTLMAVQAVPIALAAIPLSVLAAEVSRSPTKGLIVAGLYVAWAPMYAGMPNSFHLEGFLPVMFFSLVLVWYRKQYALGLVLGVIAGLTLDAAPVFVALVGIIFLTYPIQAAIRVLRQRSARPSRGTGPRSPVRVHRFGTVINAFFRLPATQACLALILVSVGVFFSMRILEAHLLAWLGYPGNSLAITRGFGSLSNLFTNLDSKVLFWVVMLATVGFLPLLYPRILILLVPWMGYTFLQKTTGWYVIASHYVAIAAVPLFLGTALGISALPLRVRTEAAAPARTAAARRSGEGVTLPGAVPQAESRGTTSGTMSAWHEEGGRATAGVLNSPSEGPTSRTASAVRTRRSPSRSRRATWMSVGSILLIAGIAAANVGLNPINPVTAPTLAASGRLFSGAGDPYRLTLDPSPGYQWMVHLASLVPANAPLLVQGQFYPLVSADPNAYPQNGPHPPHNPFNSTNPPEFVLASRGGLGEFKNYVTNFTTLVWNGSVYGVRGWVQSTRLGSIFLFELGYAGPTTSFGPVVYPQLNFGVGSTLTAGPAGKISTVRKGPSTITVISSGANHTGRMWKALDAHLSLPAGNYTLLLTLRVTGNHTACAAVPGNTTLLAVTGLNAPKNAPLFEIPISEFDAGCRAWNQLSFPIDLKYPVAWLELSGDRSVRVGVGIDLASVELLPLGS